MQRRGVERRGAAFAFLSVSSKPVAVKFVDGPCLLIHVASSRGMTATHGQGRLQLPIPPTA